MTTVTFSDRAFPGDPSADNTLPSRRERLRAYMRLKSQRQLLIIALAGAAALCLLLSIVALRGADRPETVALGTGKASVDAMPLASADLPKNPAAMAAKPSPSTSPIGTGEASYYGAELAGNRTASGERFDPRALTAAHRTLPMGSRVNVINPRNGESVVVRINDRGPFHGNRVIDLSHAAARVIGLTRAGTGRVKLELML